MAQSSQELPKLPNVDDIGDLAEQVQEITDVFSCLLLREAKWRKGLLPSQRKLLDSSINQFCGFCDATVTLLETFAHLSNSFALLFNSIIERKGQSWIEDMARSLRSEIESVMKDISQIERLYTDFTLTLGGLMRIAPEEYRQGLINDKNDKKVFERLEAFWKVIDTQLSNVLEGRAGPPYLGATSNAKNKWQEYQGCLLGASEALMQASDSIKGTANGLGACRSSDSGLNPPQGRSSLSDFVWRGFMAFWWKLKQRRAYTMVR